MAFETGRMYDMPFYHPSPAPVPPAIQSMNVAHIHNMPYQPIISEQIILKPPVCAVVPQPPDRRITVDMPEVLYKAMICEPDLSASLEEDMVTTCSQCSHRNYTWEIKWKNAKNKLKHMEEFMNVLKKQVQFSIIPSTPAPNPATSITSNLVCALPPPDPFLKSNLSATAQEFRPIQNQKQNVNLDETHNANKETYSANLCRVSVHEETQSRLPNEPLDANDSGTLESGIDSGVHDSGVSDSGVTDPTITDSAAERYTQNEDIGNACNTCEMDGLKNDKDAKKKTKKKRPKSRPPKSDDGSLDNLASDTVNEAEYRNQNVEHYKTEGRASSNEPKSNAHPYRAKLSKSTDDWSNKGSKKQWNMVDNRRSSGKTYPPRDEAERNGQLERDHYADSKSQRQQSRNTRRDANSDSGRSSTSLSRKNNSNSNYNFKKSYNKSYGNIVHEVDGNLFSAGAEYSLAHCVAEDLRMGAGIAVQFRSKFNNVAELLEQRKRVGDVAVLEDNNRFIFYLITKQLSSGKPTLDSMKQAIKTLKEECIKNNVKKLAMPKIGCGLDKLNWRTVSGILNDEFYSTDIELVVYNFKEDEDNAEVATQSKKTSGWKHTNNVVHRDFRLVNIEEETALVVYGTIDGYMDEVCESINVKHPFKDEYLKKCKTGSLGDVIEIKVKSEYVFVLIARENASSKFSFKCLENCIKNLNGHLKKKLFEYVGFEFIEDRNDPTFNEKVETLFRNCIHRSIQIHACNPKSNSEHNYYSQSNNDSSKYISNSRRS